MSPIACSALLCHAPIVVPDVGGARGEAAAATTAAMAAAAQLLVAARPEALVVVSPHAPRRRSFGVSTGATLAGDLGGFGAAAAGFVLPGAAALADGIAAAAARLGLPVHRFAADEADHGATVPLVFVQRAGWRGATVLLSLPHPSDDASCRRLGEAVAAAAGGARVALLASGDMSHRLRPGAPAGYDPRAARFDAEIVAAVAAGDAARLASIDPGLRDRAAEDVLESLLVAEGATGGAVLGRRVLSYEGPYGVGYLVAVLFAEGGAPPATVPDLPAAPPPKEGPMDPAQLLEIAKSAILARLSGRDYRPPRLAVPPGRDGGVFVTLYSPGKILRGCIGHIGPGEADLGREIAACAISAATTDPRFDPVTPEEYGELDLEIFLLSPPERVPGRESLDPKQYGVVVSQGRRRGVLLPDIDGVDSVGEQLGIACRKGGIDMERPFDIDRFTVEKIR